jgi:hypothetical protein
MLQVLLLIVLMWLRLCVHGCRLPWLLQVLLIVLMWLLLRLLRRLCVH